MTAAEVRSRCARGELDFRGADLRGLELNGLDLSGADLRGADLYKADLSGAVLARATCGVLLRWRLVKFAFRWTVGLVAGLLESLSATLLVFLIKNDHFKSLGPWFRYLPGLLTVIGLLHTLSSLNKRERHTPKFNAFVCLFAVAGALAILDISAYGIFFAVAFVLVMVSTVLVIMATAIMGNSRSITLGTIGGFVILCEIIGVSYDDIGELGIAISISSFLVLLFSITWASLTMVRRALAGELRYSNVRDLRTWMSSLFGTRFDYANLTGAELAQADLSSASFIGTRLDGCLFRGTRFIERARFSPGPLSHIVVLRLLSQGDGKSASFANLDLQGFAIRDSALQDADLSGADLRSTDLRGTDLLHAKEIQKVRVDPDTYKFSRWTPKYLQSLQERGVQVLSINQLPEDAQDMLLGTAEGLTLYFDQTLTALDHLVIQAVITTELGPETDCRVAEFKEKDLTKLHAQCGDHMARASVAIEGPRALVRLKASHREDLLRIADRLYRCLWERQHQQNEQEYAQALIRKQEEFDLVLSQQQQVHTAALSQLNCVFAAKTAPHLLNMELHEPVLDTARGGLDLNARKPTHRRFSLDLRQGNLLTARPPRRLAILAAQEDTGHRDALVTHLLSLCSKGWLQILHEGLFFPGDDSCVALQQIVESADLALCLISADLLAVMVPNHGIDAVSQARAHLSGALELALRRREQDSLVVIPVLVRPANVADSPFAGLKPLPGNLQPISGWTDEDAALLDVVAGVRLHLLGAV